MAVTSTNDTRRSEPVIMGGVVIGRTVRVNIAEVEAILALPDKKWDRSLGVYRRRNQAVRAVLAAWEQHMKDQGVLV